MLTEHLITFFVRFESLSETIVESSSSESSTNREISALQPASELGRRRHRHFSSGTLQCAHALLRITSYQLTVFELLTGMTSFHVTAQK